MPRVTFRAKVQPVTYMGEDTPRYSRIKVPQLTRAHCDMAAFRTDRNWGAYANSDLFLNMLNGAKKLIGVGEYIRLDEVPTGVTVDTSGFLAEVTFELPNWRR